MTKNYIFKKGNKYFLEFQNYYFNELSRRERMDFKKSNNVICIKTGYLLSNVAFMKWCRDNINKSYLKFFCVIIKHYKLVLPKPPYTVNFN